MSKWACQIGWDESAHLSEEAKASLLSGIHPSMRQARTLGIPNIGEGQIYPIPVESITCRPFAIPFEWRLAYGLDVGWRRTAAILGAINPTTMQCYLVAEYYGAREKPIVHAAAIKQQFGGWVPGVADPASRASNQHDGQKLFEIYTGLQCGLKLSLADNAVEAGITDVWTMLSTGQLKVFDHLENFFREFRFYRREKKKGSNNPNDVKIVKVDDHLMDAGRYLVRSGFAIASQQPREKWLDFLNPQHRQNPTYDPFRELDQRGKEQKRRNNDYTPFS